MNITLVKEQLKEYIDSPAIIKCSLGRNKFEKYHVTIKKLYDNIFIVERTINNNVETKSFSYNDVIMKTIKIDFLK